MLLPADIPVLLAVRLQRHESWTYTDLAVRMGISASMAHRSVGRARDAGILVGDDRQVLAKPLRDILEHAVRWIYYPELGPLVRGIPTAHSSPAVQAYIAAGSSPGVVWPADHGTLVGQSLVPLYSAAAKTPESWIELYEVLCLVDALRIGRRREVEAAMGELRRRLEC